MKTRGSLWVAMFTLSCGAEVSLAGPGSDNTPSDESAGTSSITTDNPTATDDAATSHGVQPTSGAGDAEGGGDGGTGATTSMATSGGNGNDDGPDTIPGCGQVPGDILDGEIVVGAHQRTYLIDIPDDYDPNVEYPLFFIWHSLGESGWSAQQAYSVQHGPAIWIYPDALIANAINEVMWDQSPDGIDVQLFDALYAEVSQQLCFDPDRVFAFGHSLGASFTNLLGCERGDVLTGIAAAAGHSPHPPCAGPVAAMIGHGTEDYVIDYDEGEWSIAIYTMMANCSDQTVPTEPLYEDDVCHVYQGCTDQVVFCPYDWDHSYPYEFGEAAYEWFIGL